MEKIILRPLETFETDGMKFFAEKLENEKRLFIISGKASVGKTGFCFKFFNYQKLQSDYRNYLFVHFDKTIEYWKKKLQRNNPKSHDQVHFKELKRTQYHKLKYYILQKKEKYNYHGIIIDGIYHCPEFANKKLYTGLLLDLMDMSYALQIPILLTERQKKPVIIPFSLLHAHRQVLPETWFIERPQYLIGEVRKFGDNRVLIY